MAEKSYFYNENDEAVVNEDRLSTLPDELIHQILGCIDTKFAVQSCLLSPRWKLLWTSMPCLSFDSDYFNSLLRFGKFVNHVLTHRNHQTDVSSIKLRFKGASSQDFARQIPKYVFANNVQELNIVSCSQVNLKFSYWLFCSPSLKHFTLSGSLFSPCLLPTTPWDFPALTTLYLSNITLCDDKTKEPVDLFSKCVNLKDLTLKDFNVGGVKVFDIIAPRLSNLMLIDGTCSKVMNLITPQLENLTIMRCSIDYLNTPPRLSSLILRDLYPSLFSIDRNHSLNKVNLYLHIHRPHVSYTEEVSREIISMLQELHSVGFITLNTDIVERLSAFPGLLSHHPSSFSNLLCLNVDSSYRKDLQNFKLSTQARIFLLEKSPNSTFIMDLPKKPTTKAMWQRDMRVT